jgi:hypothetical protein
MLIAAEALLPGGGLLTLTPNTPEEFEVPVAVSSVDERNVVSRGVPAKSTCAPFTKPLPVIVREIEPTFKVAGVTLPMRGAGLSNVTLLVAAAFELAALTAVIVMVLGEGRDAGAV